MKTSEEHLSTFFAKTEHASSFGEPTKTVVRLPELLSSGSVLDLGAGDGRHALYLAEKGFQVTAVDASPSGLAKLQRLAETRGLTVQTAVADASTYSIDHDYDAIVVVLVFQCLTEQASIRLLQEMKVHTKPGGIHVVNVFTKSGDRFRLDRVEDPTAFYPEDGWLKEWYRDWEIIEEDSSSSPLIGKFHADGAPMTSVVERIIARKPIA